jgi:molybdopterin-guanine dinucleotide biosynthesis protein B
MGSQRAFGIIGWSGSGKTTLIERVVPRLTAQGLTVSLVKHAHRGFDLDRPGKDSYRHREAGCAEVLLASDERWALMHELRGAPTPSLEQLLQRLTPVDVVLVEGFKADALPKLEVHRPALGKPPIYQGDPGVLAVASDTRLDTTLPCFQLDDPAAIAHFIVTTLGLVAQPARRQ